MFERTFYQDELGNLNIHNKCQLMKTFSTEMHGGKDNGSSVKYKKENTDQ